MPEPRVFRRRVSEAGTKYPAARVTGALSNNVLVQGDFTGTVLVQVFDLVASDPDTAVYSNTRTIANTVFNSLQTWSEDTVGYNFRDAITSNQVTFEGGHTYRVCYVLQHTSQGNISLVFEMLVDPLLGR